MSKKKILNTIKLYLSNKKSTKFYSTYDKDSSKIDKTEQLSRDENILNSSDKTEQLSKDENILNSSLQNNTATESDQEIWNVRKINPKNHSSVYEKGSGRKIIIPKGNVHPDPDIHAKLHKSSIDYESKDPNGIYPEIPDDQYIVNFWDLPVATMADRVDRVQKLLVRRAGTEALIKQRQKEKEEEQRLKAEEIKLKNIADLAESTEASSSVNDTTTNHEMTSDQKEVDVIGSNTDT